MLKKRLSSFDKGPRRLVRILEVMTCARCGNGLHRVPMFDLPRRVKEFACMCCGERFWTVEGKVKLFRIEHEAFLASRQVVPEVLSIVSPN